MDSSIRQITQNECQEICWCFGVYINALTAINDGGEFKRSNKKIYPREPELKKENIDYSEGSLFDLGIKIIKSLTFSFMIKEMISHFR